MKKRTVVVAWLFFVYSLITFLIMMSTINHYESFHSWIFRTLGVWAVQCPLWIALLKKKWWAWSILLVAFAAMNVWGVCIVFISAFHHLHQIPIRVLGLLIFGVFPFWILLTDRPSTWCAAE